MNDDSIAAKFRMRRVRAQQGGMTVYDRARNYAISKTLEQHRGTFHMYRMEYLNRHCAKGEGRSPSGTDPNRKTVDV